MTQMTFLINDSSTGADAPVLQVTITENPDGSLAFQVTQLAGYVGDLRGLFFDVADESLLGHLTASGTGLTAFLQGDDSVSDLGGGANMNGLLGGDGGYDVGLEIGDSGLKGADDYRSFDFTLASDLRALTLADFSSVSFGARITSVGLDANLDGAFETSRTLSAKTGEATFAVISAQKDVAAVDEDGRLAGNVLQNDGAAGGDVLAVTGWSGGDLGVAYAVQELGFATITLNADGSYTLDASAVDGLAAGATLSHVFTYDVLQTNAEGTSTHTVSFKVTVTGTNDAPVIAGETFTAAIGEAGSNVDTGVLGASGSFAFDDLDASDVHGVGFTPVGATLGTLATLEITDAATGTGAGNIAWSYTVDAAQVAYLAAGETRVEEFLVTVTDNDGTTDTATVRVTVSGTNDAPVAAGEVFTAEIEEAGANADTGVLSVGGTIGFDDADLTDGHSVAFASVGSTLGTLSALEVETPAAGSGAGSIAWTYAVDAAQVAYLAAGETRVEEFVVTVSDAAGATDTATVRVTVTGSNDAPMVAGEAFVAGVAEAGSNADTGTLATAGSFGFDDADLTDAHAVAFAPVGSTMGTLSALTITAAATGAGAGSVEWTYAIDADKVAYLAAGESLVEEFVVTVTDGAGASDTATVRVTVTGGNDAPVIAGEAFTGAVDEAASNADTGALSTEGSVRFGDADLSDTHAVAFTPVGTTLGNLSALAVAAAATGTGAGSLEWTYTVDAGKVAHLAAGETLVEEFLVTVSDAAASDTATVRVTITGSNDAPVIAGEVFAGSVDEAGSGADHGTLAASGSFAFDDADLTDAHAVGFAPVGATLGTLSAVAVAEAATGLNAGKVDWSYVVDAGKVAHLAAGETLVEEFLVTVTDSSGAADVATLRVTVQGTNDAPVIGGEVFTGGIAEAGSNADVGALTATGAIAFDDADLSDAHSVAFASVGTTLGTLSLLQVADAATGEGAGTVAWSYSVDAAQVAYLAAGETRVEEFLVTVGDGQGGFDTATVRVTITGSNDVPVLADTSDAAAVMESSAAAIQDLQAISGSFVVSDSDIGNILTAHVVGAPQVKLDGQPFALPSAATALVGADAFTLGNGVSDGGSRSIGYTYDPGAASLDFLGEGQTLTVTYTVTVSDGASSSGTQDVTFTITGTNDAPTLQFEPPLFIVSEGGATLSGTQGFGDDLADGLHMVSTSSTIQGSGEAARGQFMATAVAAPVAGAGGQVAWNYQLAADAYDALAGGESVTEVHALTVTDQHGASATSIREIIVQGVNDAPVIAGETFAAAVAEAGSNADTETLGVAGSFSFDDPDLTDTHAVSFQPVGATRGTLSAALGNGATGAGAGSVSWTYTVDAAQVAYLAAGETLVEEFIVRVSDDDANALSDTATVRVTITGSNDAPLISGDTFFGVAVEAGSNADTGAVSTAGSFAFQDADATDAHSVTFVPVGATLGTLTSLGVTQAAAGASGVVGWTYVVDADKVAHLAAGETLVEEFIVTLRDDDGAPLSDTATIRVTVVGTNDGPVATPALIATNEDQAITGQLGASDADASDVLAFSVVDGPEHGTLELAADGSYRYVPGSGYSGSDTFTYKVVDSAGAESTASASIKVASAAGQPGQVTYIDTTDLDDVVSNPVTGNQPGAEVAALADGGHVVVWSAYYGSLGDNSGAGVYQQRYDASGEKVGVPMLVNATVADNQSYASVAANGQGWVVVWSSYNQDGSGWGVYQQRYDGLGAKIGGEVLVNQTTSSDQLEGNVGELRDGGYVVSWTGYNSASGSYDVYARVYNANGSARTPEFVTHSNVSANQGMDGVSTESVIGLAGGGFVVVWREAPSAADTSGTGAFARVFSATGQPLGNAVLANTTTAGDQSYVSVGAVGTGFVVTWSSTNQDGSGWGIYAQRFDATGAKIGGEFQANTWTYSTQVYSKVVELQDGGFVIAWQSYGVDGSNTYSISGQRYDSSGNAVGGEFVVDNFRAGHGEIPSLAVRDDGALVVTWRDSFSGAIEQKIVDDFDEDTTPIAQVADDIVSHPITNAQAGAEVAALGDGGHVVVWTAYYGSAADTEYGIFQQRYDADGNKVGVPALVNTTTAGNQIYGSVAANAQGWVVVWSSYNQDGSGYGIYQQRYDGQGARIGGEVLVNQTTSSDQYEANVSELASGGYVVSWNGVGPNGTYEMYARVYNADGSPRSPEFIANSSTTGYQYIHGHATENVAGLSGGGFVVTWRDDSGSLDNSGPGVVARVFNASGAAVSGEILVNATTASTQYMASVGAVGTGFVVTWSSSGQDGNGWGVYAQRFDATGTKLGTEFQVNTWTYSNQMYSKVVELADGGFVVAWQSYSVDGTNTWQISGQRYDSSGNAVDGEFIVDAVDFGHSEMPSMAVRDDGALVVTWRDSSTGAIEQKIVDDFSEDTTPIADISTEDVVSTPIVSVQSGAEVAALADGGHVVVWNAHYGSPADPQYGVYQQRYDADGNKVGTPSGVNTTTAGNQYEGSVAANGTGWVVAWSAYNQDGSEWGVYHQRYAADGSRIGGEVLVNQTTASNQIDANVGELADGGYVVSWNGYNPSVGTYDVFARAYNANGTARTPEFIVNSNVAGYQYTEAWTTENVIGLSGGGFAVVWRDDSNSQDNSSGGIFTRVFDSNGQPVGNQALVNTTTVNHQFSGSVAALGSGFVVTWTSYQQDGSGYGIYAQRFDASGAKVGGEMQVNAWTSSDQLYPKAIELDDGGFVVAWQSHGVNGTNSWQISGQRFDADGERVEGEFIVNGIRAGQNEQPSVAVREDGALVVTWVDWSIGAIEQKIVTDFGAGSVASKDLVGTAGNDSLLGSSVDDELAGAAGADRIDGLGGDDLLTGGSGGDTFVFSTAAGAGNVDEITDFVSGEDRIELVAAGTYASLPVGALDGAALDIVGQGAAASADTRVIYDPTTGALYFDADGTGAGAAQHIAVLGNAPATVQASDFVISSAS